MICLREKHFDLYNIHLNIQFKYTKYAVCYLLIMHRFICI